MRFDYHTHSTYSDGSFLWSMARAAEEAGFEGIGFADHCNVSPDSKQEGRKKAMGFNLDTTYDRRREGIDLVRDRFDIRVFDAVEMDYEPEDEAAIREFLDSAGFDYAIGSVHYLDDVNVHIQPYFERKPEAERRELVAQYFDKLVALAESELFDVAAHPDLFERTPALRGLATREQYERAAEAFADSRTVPEVNAGRALREYGEFHPNPTFLDVLAEYGVELTAGTDSHDPADVGPRKTALEETLAERGLEVVELDL
ncbi:PHP domain-containing protein [Salinirubellus salinus]|uniref:histidinol-phosphatase n=1 Tax=Salinirubellus salinus TaxID=1364945 RepID=A0A9E7U7S0_9EURY|nr:PHP domain-containing protein [Salinirubellus salinus]UWM53866.1 PHP domain-containing protein [Salinirubellus salinus]